MTDNTPRPKRKRWRWIIAGVLLFVLSVACWWNWPRGDAKFVGKWEVVIDGLPVVGLILHRSGVCEYYEIYSSSDDVTGKESFYWHPSPAYGTWAFADGMFQTGPPGNDSRFERTLALLASCMSLPLIEDASKLRITETSPDEFVLHSGGEMILRRVPK